MLSQVDHDVLAARTLLAADRERPLAPEPRRRLGQLLERLRKTPRPDGPVYAMAFDAARDARRAPEDAAGRLSEAARGFERIDMGAEGDACRWRAAELSSDRAGMDAAADGLARRGAREPERWARVLVPGPEVG